MRKNCTLSRENLKKFIAVGNFQLFTSNNANFNLFVSKLSSFLEKWEDGVEKNCQMAQRSNVMFLWNQRGINSLKQIDLKTYFWTWEEKLSKITFHVFHLKFVKREKMTHKWNHIRSGKKSHSIQNAPQSSENSSSSSQDLFSSGFSS